ncbi:MAG: hypothetical protein ACRC9L_03910 [Brevinema sp.]
MSQQTVKINPFVYVGGLVIIALGILPLTINWKFNNFSKNWLNNDYAKNLLASTEEYSVFMTEGGDNQVFGSLYFTYAVKLRQDLFPYDQKGNIFKRIYGDMRYVTGDVVDSRMQIVDQGLFTGFEPFYEAIRSSNPPYLAPYALGKPSVYLTWRRPQQSSLGDFYYKSYGQMFKVQPIRYAMIDQLAISGTVTLAALEDKVKKELGRDISIAEFTGWLTELQDEGLLRVVGASAVFVSNYAQPFTKDPRDSFIMSWNNIPNIPYYDYLSREIVISHAYESLVYWIDRVTNLENAYRFEKNVERQESIKQDIDMAWTEITKMIELGKYVGHDSLSVLHNIGILMLPFENTMFAPNKENIFKDIVGLWATGLEKYPYGWNTYNLVLWGSLQAAARYPEEAEYYLDLFDTSVTKMTNAMKHWKSMRKNIEQAQPYQQILGHLQQRRNFNPNQIAIIEQEIVDIEAKLAQNSLDVAQVQNFLQSSVLALTRTSSAELRSRVSEVWLKAWRLYKRNPDFLLWHLNLVMDSTQNMGVIDSALYDITLTEAPALISTTIGNNEINMLVMLIRTAYDLGRKPLALSLLDRLYSNAQRSFSSADYQSFKPQLDAFKSSIQ